MSIGKVFIAHSWSDVGVNIQTKNVAKKLAETTDVVFFTQARIGKPELYINDHLRILEWPSKRPNRLKDIMFLVKKIREEKPEILIVHFGATNICMFVAWLLGVKYRICWLHTLSGQFYLDTASKTVADRNFFLRKKAYRWATHIIALNEYGVKDALEQYKIKKHKIYKIYNGIGEPPSVNKPTTLLKSIRFVGRLEKSKGIDILLEAFSKFYAGHKDFKLEIAGKGNEELQIRSLISTYRLDEAVILHGYLNNYTASMKFISDAYCLVVPSRMDNFPTVILEAMAGAVPVIATCTGGIPDMITNNREGLLIEPGNADALANAMKRLAADLELRDKLAQQAKQTFEEKFSMEKHVSDVITFLHRLKAKD